MKNPWAIVGIIAAVLIAGAVLYSNAIEQDNNEGVEVLSHVKGDQDSKVKLVEYSDFQCPACAGFQATLEALLEEVGDDVSFEFKQFPLSVDNPTSMLSALAAEAAGQQGRFFEFHDLLYKNQLMWSTSATPNAHFTRFAEELGLDIELFKQHMSSSVLIDKIKSERTEGINLGVTGTPSFFLNDELMVITSFEDFIQQVLVAVDPSLSSSTEDNKSTEVRFGI